MSWAVDCRVKGSHKLVLMLLAEAHNGHTGACFPSQDWIEEKSGLGDSTVSGCLKDLEDWGLLTRHTRSLGRGRGSRRDFELHLQILDPQNLEVQNLGVGPPDSGSLDPQISMGQYKDKPEKEPEGTGIAREVFDFYNRTAEQAGWVVHAKLTDALRKPLNARIEEYGADKVMVFISALSRLEWTSKGFNGNDFRATLTYITRPRTFAEHFDKLVSNATSPLFDATAGEVPLATWEKALSWYAETGQWDIPSLSPAPHQPGCKAPHDLLLNASVKRRIALFQNVDGRAA